MRLIIGIGRGHADKKILIAFTGQQIPVAQRFFAKVGQQIVPAAINIERISHINRARVLCRATRFLLGLRHFNTACHIIPTGRCVRIPKIHSCPQIAAATFDSFLPWGRGPDTALFMF